MGKCLAKTAPWLCTAVGGQCGRRYRACRREKKARIGALLLGVIEKKFLDHPRPPSLWSPMPPTVQCRRVWKKK